MSQQYQKYHTNNSDLFLRSKRFSITYGQLYRFTNKFRAELKKCTTTTAQTDCIVLYLKESELSVVVIAACWLSNITFIPCSSMWNKTEINQRLKQVDYDLIVTTADLQNNLSMSTKPTCLVRMDWLKKTESPTLQVYDYDDKSSIFAKIFTSGSTGTPKLVPLSRQQMYLAATASSQRIVLEHNMFWLLCLPLHHIGGVAIILRALISGSAVFFSYPFKPDTILDVLHKYQGTKIVSLVPTMLHRLLRIDHQNRLSELRAILIGGGPINRSLVDEAVNRRVPIFLSYGMTETCAQIASRRVESSHIESNQEPGLSILPPNKVEIRDKNLDPMPPEKKGFIWLKGPQVFEGYEDGAINKKSFDGEGWFYTHDYGWVDGAGNLHIAERADDVIITGGENVMAREVEQHLIKLPDVIDAAVIGVPDEEWGQRIVAYIVPADDFSNGKKISRNAVRSQLKSTLSSYKLPQEVQITRSLPKTSLGKTKKNLLKDKYPNGLL